MAAHGGGAGSHGGDDVVIARAAAQVALEALAHGVLVDIVNRKGGNLDEHTIREELEGNLCRCTGYHNIVAAVKAGAANMGAMRQAAE